MFFVLLLVTTLFSTPAKAQNNTFVEDSCVHLSEVVVTGLTGSTRINQLPAPVAVISPEELQSHSSTNIIDAISHQPGMSQITTGSGISKPVIRGLGYNRVLVVNDGIRQEGQQWGDEHGIEVDGEAVHSVEIMKGPASLMYGSDAMAGVILLHDAPLMAEGEVSASASTEYQTNSHLFAYSANTQGNKKGFVWNWRWTQRWAGEFRNPVNGRVHNSQFRERALKGMLGMKERWGHSLLKMSYFHQRPGIIEAPDEDPFQKINHYKVVTDNMFYVGDGVLKAIVGYQHNRRQEYEENQVGLDFMLHTINYDVRYVFPFSWKLNVGTNGMWQQSKNKGVEALIPAYHLIDFGIFSTASESFGPVHVSGGLRFDHRHVNWEPINTTAQQPLPTSKRSFYAVTGSIGAIWNITPNLDLRLNIARGFRAPNMSELGSDGEHEGTFRYEVGNADLKPEYSWQGDLGLDFSSEFFSAKLSLFANRITNYIFAEKTGGVSAEGTSIFRFTQGDARIIGGEATVILHPVHHLHWENSFSYVNSVQMHQPEETKYLPFTPAPRWMSTIHYDIKGSCTWIKNLFAEAQMECYLKQNNVYRLNDTETPTPSYTLFNVVTGTDFLVHGKRFASLHLSVNNLFNRAYQNHLSRLKEGGIYNMGRNIAMKVIFTI